MTMQPVVLVLRPEGVLGGEVERFAARGWAVRMVHPLGLQADENALARLPEAVAAADAVFWVSPGAVGVASAVLGETFAPDAAGKIHIAVGKSTAQRLRGHGCVHVLFPADGHDSEAVMRLPVWRERSGSLLVVRGEGGRDVVADGAASCGWQVRTLAVYRRVPKPVDWQACRALWDAGCLKAVYVTAWSVAQAWLEQMPAPLRESWQSLLYLTHHPRVAAVLQAHGLNAHVLAEDAGSTNKEFRHE